jgi:hypothetical protein
MLRRMYLGQGDFYGTSRFGVGGQLGWLAGWLVTGAACALQHYSESQEVILFIGPLRDRGLLRDYLDRL